MTTAEKQPTRQVANTSQMAAQAVVFEAPGKLSLQSVQVVKPEPADVVVDIFATGISTGTERLLWDGEMPDFPGMGYPLIPGYEAIGRVTSVGSDCDRCVGETVFIGGAQCFPNMRSLFGSAASRLVVPESKAIHISNTLGNDGLLLALAATAHHALNTEKNTEKKSPTVPDLIIGHGVLGRLMARLCIALGYPPPTVWEINPARQSGAHGYQVVHPDTDDNQKYRCIVDVSGDSNVLDTAIARLSRRQPDQETPAQVVLAGFYKAPLSFQFAAAFMREVRIQVASEWQPQDMHAVIQLLNKNALSLSELITHTIPATDAAQAYEIAFRDDRCLKMALDWSSN